MNEKGVLVGGGNSPFAPSFVQKNAIKIDFVPADSEKVTSCERIVDIQFARLYADGTPMKPGAYYSGFAYRDAVTTDEFWWVDFLNGETTPDYQQGGKGGQDGAKTPALELNAWITDAPQTGGGDKGFKTPSNPNGWEVFRYEFYTFCWCMKGDQCGSWYEGMSWQYVRTADEYAVGSPGTATIIADNLTDLPADLLKAFEKFNATFGYKPCEKAKGAQRDER